MSVSGGRLPVLPRGPWTEQQTLDFRLSCASGQASAGPRVLQHCGHAVDTIERRSLRRAFSRREVAHAGAMNGGSVMSNASDVGHGPIPDGWRTITPRIVVEDPETLVQFLRDAFGATGELQTDRPSILSIGDSRVMVSGVHPRAATTAFLYLYVDDADTTYQRALAAGAASLEEPQDMPYGDRRAMVED